MKYKVRFVIESEFECVDKIHLKEKMWNSISKLFEDCIFFDGNKKKKHKELEFVTLIDEDGNIIDLEELRGIND